MTKNKIISKMIFFDIILESLSRAKPTENIIKFIKSYAKNTDELKKFLTMEIAGRVISETTNEGTKIIEPFRLSAFRNIPTDVAAILKNNTEYTKIIKHNKGETEIKCIKLSIVNALLQLGRTDILSELTKKLTSKNLISIKMHQFFSIILYNYLTSTKLQKQPKVKLLLDKLIATKKIDLAQIYEVTTITKEKESIDVCSMLFCENSDEIVKGIVKEFVKNKYSFSKPIKIPNPGLNKLEQVTPLMICLHYDRYDLAKYIISNSKVNLALEVQGKKGTEFEGNKFNLFSFSKFSPKICDFLVQHGYKWNFTFGDKIEICISNLQNLSKTGLTYKHLSFELENLLERIADLVNGEISKAYLRQKLSIIRTFHKALYNLSNIEFKNIVNQTISTKHVAREQAKIAADKATKEISSEATRLIPDDKQELTEVTPNIEKDGAETADTTAIVSPLSSLETNLDFLLFEYFVERTASIAAKIRNIIKEDSKQAFKLIAALTEEYTKATDIDSLVHELLTDPKLIHKYYTMRKKIEATSIDSKKHISDSWKVGEDVIAKEKVIEIHTNMKSKLYIYIDESLSIDTTLAGLDNLKLLAKNSLGQNGIKIRSEKGITYLKTNSLGDQRLVGVCKFYKNAKEELLIILNKSMSHTEIENLPSCSIKPITMEAEVASTDIVLVDEKIDEEASVLGADEL